MAKLQCFWQITVTKREKGKDIIGRSTFKVGHMNLPVQFSIICNQFVSLESVSDHHDETKLSQTQGESQTLMKFMFLTVQLHLVCQWRDFSSDLIQKKNLQTLDKMPYQVAKNAFLVIPLKQAICLTHATFTRSDNCQGVQTWKPAVPPSSNEGVCKGKVKETPWRATQAQKGNRGIAPLIRNLGARW